MSLFQKSVVNKYLSALDDKKVDKAFDIFKSSYSEAKISEIQKIKEEEYQDGFLRDLFVNVLGYILKPEDGYNLTREYKNQSDAKKADGAILKDGKAIAVIELKSTKTQDLTTIINQAFGYKNNQPGCHYVITSNFQQLRFYIDYTHEWEEFDLFNLDKEEFKLLYLLLNKKNIFSDLPLTLKEETKLKEKDISEKLYKDYSNFKNKIYENLVAKNSQYDKLTLFKKSQKFLDRLLFIFFAEDTGLIPPNTISIIIDHWKKLKELDAYSPLYNIYKKFFVYFDKGSDNESYKIPKYNGGLFATDEILDKLIIDDEILKDDALLLSSYDFNTDIDVNILGHIFEHSLSEIEEITAEIEGREKDNKNSKRKKDGVFYTPQYITQYIVENTVGKLCSEKRKELDLIDIEIDESYRLQGGNLSKKGSILHDKLDEYKKWLISLKILDPACGSGAFLNQALNFLITEHKQIDGISIELTGDLVAIHNTDKAILENNLYGVDINDESVEIAKLSLWLRTAQKGRELSNLSNNIKCGNSLIDDPEVAGDKAFNWKEEFKEIFDNGGFDVVIGNPPYVRSRGAFSDKEKRYFLNNYNTASYQLDLYKLFIEKACKLINLDGIMSFITPSVFLSNDYDKPLRQYLLDNFSLNTVATTNEDIFDDASVKTVIFAISRHKANSNVSFYKIKRGGIHFEKDILQQAFIEQDYLINENIDSTALPILTKMNIFDHLGDYFEVKNGIKVRKELLFSEAKDDDYKPFILGKNISICHNSFDNLFINYKPENEKLYTNQAFRNKEIFEQEKLIVRQILGKRIITTFDNQNFYTDQTTYVINNISKDHNLKDLLCIMNSKLLFYFFKNALSDNKITFPKVKRSQILKFPYNPNTNKSLLAEQSDTKIRLVSIFVSKKEQFQQYFLSQYPAEKLSNKLKNWYTLEFSDFIKELNKIIKINRSPKLSKTDEMEWMELFEVKKTEALAIKEEIEKIDNEIDNMVFDLYGLTAEERAIVCGE